MLKFKAASMDWMQRVAIIAYYPDHSTGKIGSAAQPVDLVMKPHEPGGVFTRGTFEFEFDEAKNLMDALWEAGVRPTEFKSPSGEVNRLEAHLADMRTLVFKKSVP